MPKLRAIEICAGAGGQAIGLHRAGFSHELAIELDANAAATLRANTNWPVAEGDVADVSVWDPADYKGVDLLAGGVPCPPFSIAGKQLGTSDERDLFAWAIEQVGVIKPRAVLLENVRGLASSRFSAYRQRVMDRLAEFGYVGAWKLLQASDFGVPQLRPRFVLVAMKPNDAQYFEWPTPQDSVLTVGDALKELMAANGWTHADEWSKLAQNIGPTLVGGSKKHGGADLGPTRAKQAWSALSVDGRGVADSAPGPTAPHPSVTMPKITIAMAARLQGWTEEMGWQFIGGKTSQYRQIGNAFPPPVAEAIGRSISRALRHIGPVHEIPPLTTVVHDPLYRLLSDAPGFVLESELARLIDEIGTDRDLATRVARLERDFDLERKSTTTGVAYKLGEFRGFTGQNDHERHAYLKQSRSKVS